MRKPVSLVLATLVALALAACRTSPPAAAPKTTFSSFDVPARGAGKEAMPAGAINFQNADVEQVLAIYQELSGRAVVRGALPHPTITVQSRGPLNRVQALQLLDTALAEQGIAMVLSGDLAVKAVPAAQAAMESPPEITLPADQLPDSGSFMMRTVKLKKVKAVELIPVLQPFAKTPNALLPISTKNLLVIRDYSSNVRQMLQMIAELEMRAQP